MRDVLRRAAATLLVGMTAVIAGCAGPDPVVPADPIESGAFGEDMVRCLAAKGWTVQVDDNGAVVADGIPDAQMNQFRADRDSCLAAFDYDEFAVTPDMASSFYDKQLAVAECLRELGYDIPDAPSREAFVEELVATGLSSWLPYDAVVDAALAGDPDARREAEAACPQPTSW